MAPVDDLDPHAVAELLGADASFRAGSLKEQADMIRLMGGNEHELRAILRKLVLARAIRLQDAVQLQRVLLREATVAATSVAATSVAATSVAATSAATPDAPTGSDRHFIDGDASTGSDRHFIDGKWLPAAAVAVTATPAVALTATPVTPSAAASSEANPSRNAERKAARAAAEDQLQLTRANWSRDARPTGTPWELQADEWRFMPLLQAAPEAPAAVIIGAVMNPAYGYSDLGNWRSAQYVENHLERLAFSNETVRKHVDTFLASSAARRLIHEDRLIVRVVHDAADMPEKLTYRGVKLHRVAPVRAAGQPPLPAQDARWEAEREVLLAHPPAPDACVFAVDLYDVRLIGDLPALCPAHDPDTLFVGSDLCPHNQPAKGMMEMQAVETGFNVTSQLRHFLNERDNAGQEGRDCSIFGGGCEPYICPRHECVPSIAHNVGIVGGRFQRVFLPLLNDMISRTRFHYSKPVDEGGGGRKGRGAHEVVDMLVLNEIALSRTKPLERGWPHGRVNMPMWGNTCDSFAYFCRATREHLFEVSRGGGAEKAEQGVCGNKDMLAAQQASFVFTHKLGCGQRLTC